MNRGDYFIYLTKLTGRRRKYNLLLSYLFDVPFRWSYKIPTDANRAKDGIFLRDRYANESGDYSLFEDKKSPCSILEMLIALCIRIEDDIMAEPGDEHPERWFWEIIRNLDLIDMTDKHFDERKVSKSIDIWLDRKYMENGRGGAFPLKSVVIRKDTRLLSIWDQMNLYLNEKLRGEFIL